MNRTLSILTLSIILTIVGSSAQSLTDKLSESNNFYSNYGKEPYAKLKIEKDVIGLYDQFGEHITDGIFIYDLHNSDYNIHKTRDRTIPDSLAFSRSSEFQKSDFFDKFSNLVVTQDAIGGTKSSFILGDQIQTRFTPLTFNKVNFKGVRWDIWSSNLQFTGLLSRTSPGALAKKSTDAISLVEYPSTTESFPYNYYNIQGDQGPGGINGQNDFSSKSPFGDYNWLWALHAQQNIANKVDVGLTYINHHVSDTKKGEKWFEGDLPEGWMPREIHFEFFDATPLDSNDAGAYVNDVTMYINGSLVTSRSGYKNRNVYVGVPDSTLLPKELPLSRPQSGNIPVIVTFNTDPQTWKFTDGKQSLKSEREIKEINFKYIVAGQYTVFVSTSKQIPLGIQGTSDPQTGEIVYQNIDKSVEDIYNGDQNSPIKISAGTTSMGAIGPRFINSHSTTYFGSYIRQSAKQLPWTYEQFKDAILQPGFVDNPTSVDKYNLGKYEYKFGSNISSITYGVDFKGEIGGVNFKGEFAWNKKKDKFPGGDVIDSIGDFGRNNRWVGTLKLDKNLTPKMTIASDLYYISPDWKTNLDLLQASRYFKETNYKQFISINPDYAGGSLPDYLSYPKPFNAGWNNIDDNDDNDYYPENDVRRYPADQSADAQGAFYTDGKIKGSLQKLVRLPSNMYIPYDDIDGVVASKSDRNRNGVPDYLEDFLLFSSDPSVFEMGNDLNHNSIPDDQDDDLQPDYGHPVGSEITADGIKTTGIKGIRLNTKWTLSNNLTVDAGLVGESILDYDLDGISDAFQSVKVDHGDFFDKKSFELYNLISFQAVKRTEGIMYQLGNEFRATKDVIRDDVIRSRGLNGNGKYIVDYEFYIDPLDYRQAITDNIVGSVTYTNIKNFYYGIRAKIGLQGRIGIPDRQFSRPYSFYDNYSGNTIFAAVQDSYPTRFLTDLYLSNKVSYNFNFKIDEDDWRKSFMFLNNLEIIPQYKILVYNSREMYGPNSGGDPSNLNVNLRYDANRDLLIDSLDDKSDLNNTTNARQARVASEKFRNANFTRVSNVPIVRINYKIAENTQLQFGVQGYQFLDFVTPNNNVFSWTWLGQVVAKSSYKGYNVTIFLGARQKDVYYNANAYDPVLQTGQPFLSLKNSEFFVQVFSGS